MTFQNEILNWYRNNKRALPWRDTTDAYVIWLSEIILQQTRVEQGLPYFLRFLEAYPSVADFAGATEEQVLKLWQGLGYYSRGRNMLVTAKQVMEVYEGVFPTDYQRLIGLKGIGDYTAAAISSFSSNESRPVLDGNVFRVLSRYFGIATPINSGAGKKQFIELAKTLIEDQPDPAEYNQAVMEFGALQCKPKPLCPTCPLNSTCFASANNLSGILPVKEKKLEKRNRYFNYFVCLSNNEILVKKRGAGDIWQELYDFPLIETSESSSANQPAFLEMVKSTFGASCTLKPLTQKKHLLTHQTIYVQFFALDNYIINFNQNADIKWVTLAMFDELPQPKVIADFMNLFP